MIWQEAVVGVQDISRERESAVGTQSLLPFNFGFEVYVLIGHFTFCVLLLKENLSPKRLLNYHF